jgi:hypothetical protein
MDPFESKEKDGAIFDFQDESETLEMTASSPVKKRRGDPEGKREVGKKELETSKPSALFKPREGRKWTVSMAVPGSIIAK